MYRLRTRDNTQTYNTKLDVWEYVRYPTCTDALAWRFNGGTQSWSQKTGSYAAMRDILVPGFHRRIQNGEVFFNSCQRAEIVVPAGSGQNGKVEQVASSCSGGQSYKSQTEHRITAGDIGRLTSGFGFPLYSDGFPIVPANIADPDDLSDMKTEVSTACLSSIGKADSNLYESLAEADKALKLLPGYFKTLGQLLSSKNSLLAKGKAVGGGWLATRYGLKPILNDVDSVMKGMLATTGRVRKTYRSQATLQSTKQEVNNSYSWAGVYTCRQTWTHAETITVRAMTLCEYYASMMSNIGLTTKGLITLPWELVPYSFVVDWFINVGDVLGALAPEANMTQMGSCLVESRELRSDYTLATLSCISGWTVLSDTTGKNTRLIKTYSRVPGPLVAGLVIKKDFRLKNLTRALDAYALLAQKLVK